MPKKEFKILGFHGGIHDNSDAKDIRDIDLREADGVSTHKIGRLVGLGNKGSAITSGATADIEPGYGLHYFSSDYDHASANNPDDYLAVYDKANTKVRFYYRDKDGSSPNFLSDEVTFGGNIKPNYYYGDGLLRIGDASFSQDSKWFGYIDQSLFWTDDRGNSTNLHDITKWDSGNQKLRKLDALSGATMKLVDMESSSPDASTITSQKGSLILGYKTTEGGEWNGNFTFGATPIYQGNQEGEISIFYSDFLNRVEDSIPLYNEQISFQVFIGAGTAGSKPTSLSGDNIFGDNRLIGLNFYFKEQADDDWIFLMHTDLKEGGKHFWDIYDPQNETTHGKWVGLEVTPAAQGSTKQSFEGVDILDNSGSMVNHIAFSDNADGTGTDWEGTGNGSTQAGKSYSNVYLRVKLSNTNVNGFDNRFGFIRVWGGAVSPLYVGGVSGNRIALKTGISDTPGTTIDTYYIPMTLPTHGTDREFRVQVLDENFDVIADSGIKTMTIEDSGLSAPPDYDEDQQEREY